MTSPAFSLLDSVMLLGSANSTADAEALHLLGLTPQLWPWQNQTLATAFVAPPIAEQPLAERLVWLLEQLQQQSSAFNQQQVYLVLPEQVGIDDSHLNTLLQLLMQRMPALLMAPGCRVFPYGSAGALMALNAAVQCMQQTPQRSSDIWLVAVDSLAHDSVIAGYSTTQRQSFVLSEGVIALHIGANECNHILFHAADASAGAAPDQDSAIASLFLQLAQQAKQPLAQLYLPDCGDDVQSSRWLQQYAQLHGAVDAQTELLFPSYASGELGACGGMYRLWYLLSRIQRGEITGQVAQLEISARQYRALTVFSPGAEPNVASHNSVNKDV